MNCIIIDDEPLARKSIELQIIKTGIINCLGSFNSAISASRFMKENQVDLLFLDIQMPHITGLEFARTIPKETLVIFTTAYPEYALDSYDVEAIDYLVKPIKGERFLKAINKALSYHSLLLKSKKDQIENIEAEYLYIRSERKYNKVMLESILYIEGLKDYVIVQVGNDRIITKMNLKTIHAKLPQNEFVRVNKSYVVNTKHVDSFDNNCIHINSNVIPIGNSYREDFFSKFSIKKL